MKETIKNLKRVYRYGKEYKKNLIYETIGSIFGIIISIILPILAAKQIVYLTDNLWYQLIFMSIIILFVGFISSFKTVLIRKNTQKFTVGITEKMQKELGIDILKISQSEIDNNATGVFIQRMTSDVDELAKMFTTGYGRLIGIISSIGTFISILIIDKYVFVFYVISAIILTALHVIKSKKCNLKDKEKRKSQEKVTSLTSELIRGSRDIKMLNIKKNFIETLNDNIKIKNQNYLDMRNIDIFYNYIIENLSEIFQFLLIILFIYLINYKGLTVAMAIALFSYRTKVMTNFMENISLLLEETNNFNLSFKRVFSILNNHTFEKEKFGKERISNFVGNIEFKNVVFGYNENTVLNNLSFSVKPGEKIGFVGKSGSGKTTIFNLISKMYTLESGNIYIDGYDINTLTEDSIRGNIALISQNPYLFNMSIKDNLRLVNKNVSDEEIKKACQLACLDDFIELLPEKYDTVIGEGGVILSGGQRQRLAIARAFIQNKKMILFDEATSALDNETQREIQKAIDNIGSECTVMIIAHRLSTIVNCDKIFIIEDGQILDSGTHKELLERSNFYLNLYEEETSK